MSLCLLRHIVLYTVSCSVASEECEAGEPHVSALTLSAPTAVTSFKKLKKTGLCPSTVLGRLAYKDVGKACTAMELQTRDESLIRMVGWPKDSASLTNL